MENPETQEKDPRQRVAEVLSADFEEKSETCQALLAVLDSPGIDPEMQNELLAIILERHGALEKGEKDENPKGKMESSQFRELGKELFEQDAIEEKLFLPLLHDKPPSYKAAEEVWRYINQFRIQPEKRIVALAFALQALTPYVGIENPMRLTHSETGKILDDWGFQIRRIIKIRRNLKFKSGTTDEAFAILEILDSLPDRKTQAVVLGNAIAYF